MRKIVPFALAAALLAPRGADAATHFTRKLIKIAGSTNVTATAINAHNVMTGNYDTGNSGFAFILDGRKLTTLPEPPPCGTNYCVPVPTAINDSGDVVGQTLLGNAAYLFLWSKNAYVQAANIPISGEGASPFIGVNGKDEIFYNSSMGSGQYTPYAGVPPDFQIVQTPGRFPLVASLNSHGMLAGATETFGKIVFVGQGTQFTLLTPPDANGGSEGGFINELGEVAGSYADSGNVWHGFIYRNGKYREFSMPHTAYAVNVEAINKAGRVVGYYTDTSENQHAFLYNGDRVTIFGPSFVETDYPHVAISDSGTILTSDFASGSARSYVVTCSGTGC